MNITSLESFFSHYPNPPEQGALGGHPQDYLHKLNNITNLELVWPTHKKEYSRIQLDRQQLRQLCRDTDVDVLIGYAAVMAWGGRGEFSRNYRLSLTGESLDRLREALHALRDSKNERKTDFENIQKAAINIEGLGISFYTKLLYFFRENSNAYILDQFTAKSAFILFNDCKIKLTHAGYPDPKTIPEAYDWFCGEIEEIANSRKESGWTADKVEQAMFDKRNGSWRSYLRDVIANHFNDKPTRSRENNHESGSIERAVTGLPTCLPAFIAVRHAEEYAAGRNLPGSRPKWNNSIPASVTCRFHNLITWKYVVGKKHTQAQMLIFIANSHKNYKTIQAALGVHGNYFGKGITGTPPSDLANCGLRITINGGLENPPADWSLIAEDAVDAMYTLFEEVGQYV